MITAITAAAPISPSWSPPAYWQFLGPRPGEPFTPLKWQADFFSQLTIPVPSPEPGKPTIPYIWGVNCGRRAGKTTVAEVVLWYAALGPDDRFGPPCIRLTADTEEHGYKVWDRFIWHAQTTPLSATIQDHSKARNLVTLKNGATVQLLSAHNPQALAGDGVTLWVIDEAQYLTREAWQNLFPSIAERNGVVIMFGVSEGDGPFKEVCLRGDNPKHYPSYRRIIAPTAANPYVPKWRIQEAQKLLAPETFNSLYLCIWAGEVGRLFRNVESCLIPDPIHTHPLGFSYLELPQPGRIYFGGIDLGRLQDWTVFTIWDRQGKLIAWDRFSLIGWEIQKARLVEMSKFFNHPKSMVDSTGLGDPVISDLDKLGMKVEGFQITSNQRKRQLVDRLAIRIGAGQVKLPQDRVIQEELGHFVAKKGQGVHTTVVYYEAESGYTDDVILSAALAHQLIPDTDLPLAMGEGQIEGERARGPWEDI